MAIAYAPFTIAVSGTTSGVVDLGPNAAILGISVHGTVNACTFSFQAYVPDSGSIAGGSPGPGTQGLSGGSFDTLKDSAGNTITIGTTGVTTGQYYIFNSLSTSAWTAVEGARYVKVIASAAQNGQAVNGYLITRIQ